MAIQKSSGGTILENTQSGSDGGRGSLNSAEITVQAAAEPGPIWNEQKPNRKQKGTITEGGRRRERNLTEIANKHELGGGSRAGVVPNTNWVGKHGGKTKRGMGAGNNTVGRY